VKYAISMVLSIFVAAGTEVNMCIRDRRIIDADKRPAPLTPIGILSLADAIGVGTPP
jgi:hypothetical protein